MKERLTGAIILVALIVVLVPEMLNGPIRPASRARGSESTAEESPLRSVTINLADDTRGGSGAPQPQTPSPAAPAAEPATAEPQPRAAAPTAAPAIQAPPATAHVAAPAPAPSSPAATAGMKGGGFVVQLGSFANRANAERLAGQVRGRGFPVVVSRSNRGKHLYRVQVGPAQTRAAAEQLLARLRTTGHGGPIVPQ